MIMRGEGLINEEGVGRYRQAPTPHSLGKNARGMGSVRER